MSQKSHKSQKNPNPVDINVGKRIRLRRTILGMTQEKLGEFIGVTFQQVQKYEKGKNRVGAGRLHDIAVALKAPISFFIEDLPQIKSDISSEENSALDYISSPKVYQLNKYFAHIQDNAVKQNIIELVKSISSKNQGDDNGER